MTSNDMKIHFTSDYYIQSIQNKKHFKQLQATGYPNKKPNNFDLTWLKIY